MRSLNSLIGQTVWLYYYKANGSIDYASVIIEKVKKDEIEAKPRREGFVRHIPISNIYKIKEWKKWREVERRII